jgi:hypothetical protein
MKGIVNNKLTESTSFTCEGCHTANTNDGKPNNGNLGAPIPQHLGIPPIHFERLACTTCHSGVWPESEHYLVKNSRSHFLGMHGTNKAKNVFPHIISGVYTESENGKIEPRNLIWPSFWAVKDSVNNITPLPLSFVESTIRPILALDSIYNFGDWPAISDSTVISVIQKIDSLYPVKSEYIYVSGGKFFSVDNYLKSEEDFYTEGYSWKTSHNVRPAAQALGVNGCQDCHSIGSAFFNSKINVESSLLSESGETISASTFQNNSQLYQSFFSLTFYFRPWLKFLIILSAFAILIVLLGFTFYGLKGFAKIISQKNDGVE